MKITDQIAAEAQKFIDSWCPEKPASVRQAMASSVASYIKSAIEKAMNTAPLKPATPDAYQYRSCSGDTGETHEQEG